MRLIRQLVTSDRYAIAEHLLALSEADRRFRFRATVSDAEIGAFTRGLDWSGSTHLGCFLDGALVAVLDLCWEEVVTESVAGFSLSIAAAARGQGIGHELALRALELARARGAAALTFACLPDNAAMLKLAASLDAAVTVEDGEARGRIAVAWPTEETQSAGDSLAELHARRLG